MPLLQWSDRYSIGVAIFDAEHMRLFAIANDLYDAILSGTSSDALNSILLGLADYSSRHFSHEEEFFRLSGYPQTQTHLQKHVWMREKIHQFEDHLTDTPQQLLALELARLLRDWIEDHILGDDMEYGRYLVSKGIR